MSFAMPPNGIMKTEFIWKAGKIISCQMLKVEKVLNRSNYVTTLMFMVLESLDLQYRVYAG